MSRGNKPKTESRTGKAAAREKVAQMRAAEARRRERRVRIMAVVVVLVLVGIGVAIATVKSRVSSTAPYPAAVSSQGGGIVVGAASGAANGKVPVVDIFEDFQCPFCERFESANSSWLEQQAQQGKIKVVYHPASFIGPDSVRAANAAGCASDAGKFLAFHNELYSKQPQENSGAWTNDALTALGKQVGITSSDFGQCVKNGKYNDWVKAVQQDFDKRGFTGTPTILLNGKQLQPTDYSNPDGTMNPQKLQQLVAQAG